MSQTTQISTSFSPEYQKKLDEKFPNALPDPTNESFPRSTVRPSQVLQFPGVTHESTLMVRRLMEENDRRFHIFGKLSFAHNHLPHHILTSYSLGASPKQLQATFEANVRDMAPLERAAWVAHQAVEKGEQTKEEADEESRKVLPSVIGEDNWHDTNLLGEKANYPAYLQFFHKKIDAKGGMETFEKFFLSPAANSGGKENKKGPRMLMRFMAGAFHPFIHTGFGLEFRDRVTLAEGFAQAAIHPGEYIGSLFPDNWPSIPFAKSHARRRSSQTINTDASFIDPRRTHISSSNLSSINDSTVTPLTFSLSVSTGYRNLAHPSLLELYTELCESEKIKIAEYDPDMSINDRMAKALENKQGEEIRRIADKWGLTEGELVKSGEADGWARRVEELQVLCTLLCAGTGRLGRETRVDFFLMHCLTSSIFLPSFLTHLTPPHRLVILKSYLLIVFHTALARGRPRIVPEIISNHTAFPSSVYRTKKRDNSDSGIKGFDEGSERIGDMEDPTYGNFWTEVVDNGLHAHDSHIVKSIRSLLLYSRLYGHLPAGGLLGTYKQGTKDETIPGISKLGGDVFARAVGVIFEQVGWPKDRKAGDGESFWDMSALGYDGAWEEKK